MFRNIQVLGFLGFRDTQEGLFGRFSHFLMARHELGTFRGM